MYPTIEREAPALVVGAGAAGLAAALRLYDEGVTGVAVAADSFKGGTSRNSGSDKQTYYKLSLSGAAPDSPRAMAADLFAGGCVDGDVALSEAALSAKAFYYLCEAGVPFPRTPFGEYAGYRTDHDEKGRATSVGPYTSAVMSEKLEKKARDRGILFLDGLRLIKIAVSGGRVCGAVFLDLDACEKGGPRFVLIRTRVLILATGAPAGMFYDSVYPEKQTGASGAAFEAGARGQNLTEWQYGMASLRPRWNVSGSFMQAIPRFYSTDGKKEYDFLDGVFASRAELLSSIFLKGYQWPFGASRISGKSRSGLIDLAVMRERSLGRRVYLDYTRNPGNEPVDFDSLIPEAKNYLSAAGALGSAPAERLYAMNPQSGDFYLSHGTDLRREPLEIAVCVQHNNGGLAVGADRQTAVRGLFAVGEAAGTHGVERPGGAALNAGQTGAICAAEAAAGLIRRNGLVKASAALQKAAEEIVSLPSRCRGSESAASLLDRARRVMSRAAGIERDSAVLRRALDEIGGILTDFEKLVAPPQPRELETFFILRDVLISQKVYLYAMLEYAENAGVSRGSAIYTKASRGPSGTSGNAFRDVVRETLYDPKTGLCSTLLRPCRPVPPPPGSFETEWKEYEERRRNAADTAPDQH